jgi:hypothetical protein
LRWARDQVPFAELKGEQSNAFQAGFSACTSWRVKKLDFHCEAWITLVAENGLAVSNAGLINKEFGI